ncbi:hypothetical protein TNCV_3716061 [Trichonephila clavipes]|nr:hypothetical protein TNCV_3716061 [Trichonephila clavipes]
MDLVILNHGPRKEEKTRTLPDPAPHLQSTTSRERDFEPRRASAPLHNGSAVALGMKLMTMTTWLQWSLMHFEKPTSR